MTTLIYYTVLLFIVLMTIRCPIIYHIRKKARNIAFSNTEQALKQGDSNWDEYWYQGPASTSYDYMLFVNLHKWTFKQFYPNLK